MNGVSEENFGLLIAYVVPGFIALGGVLLAFPSELHWLTSNEQPLTVAGFLYVTVVSIFVGLTASTIRWAIIDSLFWIVGVRREGWSFRRYTQELEGYIALTQVHYRYYQFYGNSVVALLFAFGLAIYVQGWSAISLEVSIATGAICSLFMLGAWDSLTKYYQRTSQVLNGRKRHD